jgi:glutamate formiminotransferase/formiminotetrahydrofolate cyclodeaminase
MQTIVESVPNFSEGRDAKKVEAIIAAMLAGPEVYLLDQEMDTDHNRSVITLVGARESIGEAALRGMGKAAELIDLTQHQGAHPRIGATDVVPFVPVAGVTLEDCVRIAEWVAEQAWRRFNIPTYLYEAAARRPERKNLENIRRGQFEGLREEVRANPERRPDFGEAALHPTAGATVVGARKFLIAYNINLDTSDVALAKTIAKKIRASSGGFPCVKAMGVELKARNLAQVSMNLTDFETTPIGVVFDAVTREAAAEGVSVVGSEIVGLIPRRALEDAAVHHLKVENFRPKLIVENRLAKVLEGKTIRSAEPPANLGGLAEGFVQAVAAPTATPGGGSVVALAGALAAALGEMVCGLTLKRKSLEVHYPKLEAYRSQLAGLRAKLLANVDRDAQSYDSVVAAMRLPKATEAEQAARTRAIEEASKLAATVPLETAEFVAEIERALRGLRPIIIPQAASDLSVALALAGAARAGALENVHVNLPSIHDSAWVEQITARVHRLEMHSSDFPQTPPRA